MSKILGQLAVAIGGLLFIAAMTTGLVRGVPLSTTLFRALIVFCLSSVGMALFFRFFSKVLFQFAAEQIMRNRAAKGTRPGAPGPALPKAEEGKSE